MASKEEKAKTLVLYRPWICRGIQPAIVVYTAKGNAVIIDDDIEENKLTKIYNILERPIIIIKNHPDAFDYKKFNYIDSLCEMLHAKMFDYIANEVKWNVLINQSP